MLGRLIALVLTTRNSPTADLYFGHACADWLAEGRVRRLAPTVFASATTRLVVRHEARAPRDPVARLVYLIDDAVDLEGADAALSRYWRFKLDHVERAAADRLLPRAVAAVASSDALAEMLRARAPGLDVRRLDPFWGLPFPDLSHHADGGPLRVGFLGSQVHGPDLAPLAESLRRFLERRPEAELVVAGGHAPLIGHPRVRALPPMGWRDWKAALPGLRLHLALYPLAETPFNAARSLNKLTEHALAGAGGLYPAAWPGAALAEAAGAGRALPPDPTAWAAALDALAADRARLAAMAEAAVALARRLDDPAPQRRLWAELLAV